MKWVAKPLLSWQEPVLFSARIRDRQGWICRGLLALGIAAGMMLASYAGRAWGGPGPKFGTVPAVLLWVFVGVFFTSMLDATSLNSTATISDDSVNVMGNAGVHFSFATYSLRDIRRARLKRPVETGRRFGILELAIGKGIVLIGIPATLPAEKIANVLHSLSVPVELAGWFPGEATTPGAERAAEESLARATGLARIEKLPEGQAGTILTPRRNTIAVSMAMGPLVVSVLGFVVLAGVVLYHLKIQGHSATLVDGAMAAGALTSLIGGFWLTSRFANLVPSWYIRSAARSTIEIRPEALFDPRDPEAVYVDVIPREKWGKASLKGFSDCGILKVDPVRRCVLFEGDFERWWIPSDSLVSVEVESHRGAGHVEGQGEGEWFYTTVIRARTAEGTWEAPVSKCHTELRPKNNALRQSNATQMRDAIRALRPAAFLAPSRSRP
jgi:hypothetical protein